MTDYHLYRRVADLESYVARLVRLVEEGERRANNMIREGRVTDVDAAKGLMKIAYAKDDEGNDVKSPWIKWAERAGAIKTWSPPTVGEQVTMFSPSGEITENSRGMLGGFSGNNEQPHDKGGEFKMTIGGSAILMTGDKITFTAAQIVTDGETHLGGEGGQLLHRKGDLDSDGDTAVGSASKVYAV